MLFFFCCCFLLSFVVVVVFTDDCRIWQHVNISPIGLVPIGLVRRQTRVNVNN